MDALLVDLDDTLLDDRGASRVAFSAFLETHRPVLSPVPLEDEFARWRLIASTHWQRFEAGRVSFLEQRRARMRDFLKVALTDDQADASFEPYARAYREAWRAVPDCSQFLIAARGIRKAIVTNGDREQQMEKIRACGLFEHFEVIVTPADCGHWKPAPGIFAAALARLGVKADRCMMIGDDLNRDILPAKALGMMVYHVTEGRGLLGAITSHARQ